MLASLGAWLLAHILKLSSSGLIQKAVDIFNTFEQSTNDTTKAAIEGVVAIKQTEGEVEKTKLQIPWFWIIVGLLMGPIVLNLWAVGLYDVLWWQHGIWPQQWSIAAWPGVYQEWASQAFAWIFTPALGIGAILKLLGK